MEESGDRSFALLLILPALPGVVPAPPGVATGFGLLMFLVAVQMLVGRRVPWLPAWARERRISAEVLTQFLKKAAPWLHRVERMVRPRLDWLQSAPAHRLFALVMVLCAVSVIIPLPMTNSIPSAAIVIICIGLMERDGLVMLLGAVVAVKGLALTCAVLFLGHQAASSLAGW